MQKSFLEFYTKLELQLSFIDLLPLTARTLSSPLSPGLMPTVPSVQLQALPLQEGAGADKIEATPALPTRLPPPC